MLFCTYVRLNLSNYVYKHIYKLSGFDYVLIHYPDMTTLLICLIISGNV
jgi:hypothetical protein